MVDLEVFQGDAERQVVNLRDDVHECRVKLQVSEKHTNFLLNVDNATSADIEGLGELVKRRVYEHSGVLLEWEIQRVGRP